MITNSIQQIINEHLKYMRQHNVNSINLIYEDRILIKILIDHGVEIQISEVGEDTDE